MKNHTNIFNDDLLQKINNTYDIYLDGDKIVVKGKIRINRKTYHSIYEKFKINFYREKRIIMVTPQAIEYWIKMNQKVNLVNVQNAINILTVTYQDTTLDNVKKILNYKEII